MLSVVKPALCRFRCGEGCRKTTFFALHNRQGYDYYSFYLLLKDCGRLKTLAVGNYRLSFGQGLVISTDTYWKTVYLLCFQHPAAEESGKRLLSSTDETKI